MYFRDSTPRSLWFAGHCAQAHRKNIRPGNIKKMQVKRCGKMPAGEKADMAQRACGPEHIPYASFIEAANGDAAKTGVTQQPFEHEFAEIPDMHAIVGVPLGIFRFPGHLPPLSGQGGEPKMKV
jgi:hypothetical protein